MYQQNKDDGLMVLEVMIEDAQGRPMNTSGLEDWADEYGLTMPVLSDPNGEIMWQYAADSGGSVGLPFTVVLDRGVKIKTIMSGANSDAALDLL